MSTIAFAGEDAFSVTFSEPEDLTIVFSDLDIPDIPFNIVALTQTEYDALPMKDATTLYLITGP